MRVVEAGDDSSPSRIDHAGIIGAEPHDVGLAADRDDPFTAHRESLRVGLAALQRRHLGIVHDQVRRRWGLRRLGPAPGGRHRDHGGAIADLRR